MNAERLLALYHRVADAPNAVPRLRRFMLDLAVRGKLVKQDPADEPAVELLKRIEAERIENGGRLKPLPNFSPEELDVIPANWCAAPLIVLGRWAIGSGFPKSEQGVKEGRYFFLKVSDMNLTGNEKYITTANNFMNETAAKRMKAKIHPRGTIIFPKIGGAIATNKRRILERSSAIDNNCLGITFSRHVNLEWAYLLLSNLDFTFYQAGTAVPALQQRTLGAIPVSVPPLPEQHRIVVKVDELMALCDRLEETRTAREETRDRLTKASHVRLRAPDTDDATFRSHARFAVDAFPALTARADQVKRLRQTILDLAVRGKLVKQNPAALRESRQGKGVSTPPRGSNAPEFGGMTGEWKTVKLGDVASVIAGQSPKSENYNKNGRGLPFYQGKKDYGERYLNPPTVWTTEVTKRAKKDHILMSVRAPVGALNIATEEICIGRGLAAIRAEDEVDRDFLFFQLLSLADSLDGSAGTIFNSINKKQLENIVLFLPPLPEQHRIVAKIEELMALCDRLEANLGAVDDSRHDLLESLLRNALEPAANEFEGGLEMA